MSTSVGPRQTSWVTGQFGVELRTASSPVGLEITELVGLALRRNPRRAHLLVSTVLGKHVPTDPDLAVGIGRLLGELVAEALGAARTDWSALTDRAIRYADPLPLTTALDVVAARRRSDPLLVLGFAETATSLGQLVAEQLVARCYLHSTRRPVPGVEIAGTFEEGHSHATSHHLLPVPRRLLETEGPMVLVDDELSTGNTAMGTIIATHRLHPRSHYVIASLIDLRDEADEAEMRALAARLRCRIDVVSLTKGTVILPDGLIDAVTEHLPPLTHPDRPELVHPTSVAGATHLPWPPTVPDGGRHGFLASDRQAFDHALAEIHRELARTIKSRVGVGGGTVIVVGTEEFMYLPLRLAQSLGGDPSLRVSFQSTTRSPVLAVDDSDYPIRRQFAFADSETEAAAPRFLYNCSVPAGNHSATYDPDLVVVLADAAADTEMLYRSDGLLGSLQFAGLSVELMVVGGVDPGALSASRSGGSTSRGGELPTPLTGPDFGSYAADEVQWLLTDLSDLDLEGDIAEREAAIQAGTAHYAESLPVEFQPDLEYQELFRTVLAESASRLALAVGSVTELVLGERGHDIALASLARAGTPIGILMRRWAGFRHGLALPHYALSIVRGRGIDPVALKYVASQHEPSSVVFVDGWTGKGAIARELTAALVDIKRTAGLNFSDDLAVLADPGYCVRTFGTRDDFLIASACLNSTVSGLVSRTVLNDAYLAPGQFHGAKFYRELADDDVSTEFLDAVTAAFPGVLDDVLGSAPALAASDREPTFAGWAAIEAIRAEYGIESINFVKPGVGETTRVLLRRVPWRILVREEGHPDHAHLQLLAPQRQVPVEVRPDLPYSCVGLIRRVSDSEPGEN